MTTKYICETAPLDLLVLQNVQMLEKLLKDEPEMENIVKKFILMDLSQNRISENILIWQDVLESGKEIEDNVLTEIENKQAVNQACMLIYTSGTTGPPKGMNAYSLTVQ